MPFPRSKPRRTRFVRDIALSSQTRASQRFAKSYTRYIANFISPLAKVTLLRFLPGTFSPHSGASPQPQEETHETQRASRAGAGGQSGARPPRLGPLHFR